MTASIRPVFSLHATHSGSLIRPKELVEACQAFDDGKLSAEALTRAQNDTIASVVKRQQELGLDAFNDGEFRRKVYFDGVFERLQGMTRIPNRPMTEFLGYIPWIKVMVAMGVKEFDTFFCSGRIARTKPFYVEEFKYQKSIVPPQEVKNIKVTMCSPTWFHQRHGSALTYDLSVYKNDDAYFDDIAIAYRAEFKELYDLGCRNIQIDDPTFAFFCSEAMVEDMKAAGADHGTLLDTYIHAINKCLIDKPSDLIVSIHMCRGNYKGMHFCEGGYSRISAKLFNNLNVDAYYLEYDTKRCGDFTPLKDLPPNKKVVLGIVSTKIPEVETVEYVCSCVRDAANAMVSPHRTEAQAMNQLAISPQCGFSPVYAMNLISEEVQWQKLGVLVNAAKFLWPQ